jgi:hypothetical protein
VESEPVPRGRRPKAPTSEFSLTSQKTGALCSASPVLSLDAWASLAREFKLRHSSQFGSFEFRGVVHRWELAGLQTWVCWHACCVNLSMKTTYGNVKFSGVLLEPLASGEDPAAKLAALREQLGVETDREALMELARILLPGFSQQRRRYNKSTVGRPSLLVRICALNGYPDQDLPDWLVAECEERLFARLQAIKASNKKIKLRQAAFQATSEEKWGNKVNMFYLDSSVDAKAREEIAKKIVWKYTKRKRSRLRHAPLLGIYSTYLNTCAS